MAKFLTLRRIPQLRQRMFGFLELALRRERQFKRGILGTTVLVIVLLLAFVPRGRYLVLELKDQIRRAAFWVIGIPTQREEVDAEWRRFRTQGISNTLKELERVYSEAEPPLKRLMRYAGNDPKTGLLRWGNFNHTLLLPSTVFEPDDTGRSYRLRPNTRSLWLRNISLKGGVLTFFLVPDQPELAEAMNGTSGIVVPGSVQTTNSWGLRGPEPDLTAPLRGIVLGDSFMQGLFIGDDQTPPECLRRHLESRFKTRVSILNTGHLGYSPEQYYYTLLEYVDRFHPQFVVMSFFANDFGGIFEVAKGEGDWEEGKYWLSEISQFCRRKGMQFLAVPAPLENQIVSRRFAGYYPGAVSNILESNGLEYLDPIEDFVNQHVALTLQGQRRGKRPATSPMFNGEIADGHFSPAGSEVWGAAVGRRLELLLEKRREEKLLTF